MTRDVRSVFAIVGMSCRFPGGANSPEKLWSLLSDGRDAWSEVPPDRFNWQSFYHPDPDVNGVVNHRGGHFLDQDVSLFDPWFFGISSAEAQALDPQQRLQLETAFEALENAGITVNDVKGSDTAVYMAIFSRDYERMMFKDPNNIAKYHMVGTGEAILANRISHVFDLKGPSVTLDTGCSGSMVALHQACQSLQVGESRMALVGGSNLMLSPDQMIPMSRLHILNDRGRCFSFDSRGLGYGRGEGVASLILKRLDAAIQDGDSIRAIIHGTGVNQDGKTPGIAVPNGQAQQDLIRSVYRRAGLDPRDIGYVEAHGTGTVAGDAIETQSISSVFCKNRDPDHPLVVGSVKPNVGHLESTSGLAGLIKTVLILEKGFIPPNLNLEELKPSLDLEAYNIRIPQRLEPWKLNRNELRFASVNSFGYGGTNGHAILSSVPTAIRTSTQGALGKSLDVERLFNQGLFNPGVIRASVAGKAEVTLETNGIKGTADANGCNGTGEANGVDQINGNGVANCNAKEYEILAPTLSTSPSLLVLSAQSEKSLLSMVNQLKQWIKSRKFDQTDIQNLSYTLCSRRSPMQWRWSSTILAPVDLPTALGQEAVQLNKSSHNTRLGFIFTGQGSQWVGMGRDLMLVQSKFMDSLRKSEAILHRLGSSSSLIEDLLSENATSRINESAVAQPTVTSLQIALVDLMRAFGIVPDAVLGHSSGEIAAAYAAGILTHEDALKVSYSRGFISSELKTTAGTKGGMIAVGLGEDGVSPLLSRISSTKGSLSIACVNSPESTTISGDLAAVEELKSILESNAVFCQVLKVDVAYHSPQMQSVASDYLQRIADIVPNTAGDTLRFISSVSGTEKLEGYGPDYWVQNLVSKVRFSDALKCLFQTLSMKSGADSPRVFVEIGPHSALAGPVRQTAVSLGTASTDHLYIPTLIRRRDAIVCVVDTVAKLWRLGHPARLDDLRTLSNYSQPLSVLHDVPPYVWDHTCQYWHESRLSREHRFRQFPYHDLLGLRVVGSSPNEPSWCNTLNEDRLPWLRDHAVDQLTVFPGSGYLCMAIEAIRQALSFRAVTGIASEYVLRNVSFSKALVIPDSPGKAEIQLNLKPTQSPSDKTFSGWEEFRISSVSQDGAWTEHCRGSIGVEFKIPEDDMQVCCEQSVISDSPFTSAGSEVLDQRDFYNECISIGNVYGPSFAMLQKLHINGHEAAGVVKVPEIAEYMPSNFLQPHLIHPTTLDTIFQANLALYTRHYPYGSIMPVSIDQISISASISREPGVELEVRTGLDTLGHRSATISATAFQCDDKGDMIPVVNVTNGELYGMGENRKEPLPSDSQRLITYEMVWKPDVMLNQPSKPLGQSKSLHDGLSAEDKEKLMTQAASLYMNTVLQGLANHDMPIPAEHHRMLVEWMKDYVNSDTCKEILSSSCDEETIYAKAKSAGVEGEIISRTGPQLLDILTGKTEPLPIMLEDGLLYRVYADDSSVRCYSHLIGYLQELVFKKPYLKVLEVGAGTGGTTLPLLTAHADNGGLFFKSYDYTDISSGFFDQVQSKFEGWKNLIQFKTLDIERDPGQQGFTEASYDLVIASNVIHATKELGVTLANIRRLLKPGGQLILLEVVSLTPPYMMTFGLLPGWWAGVDDGREQGPLLTVHRWNDILVKSGFNGTEIVMDDFEGHAHRSSLMISRPKAENKLQNHHSIKIIAGNIHNSSGRMLVRDLVAKFEENRIPANFISWPSMADVDDSIYLVMDLGEEPLLLNPSEEIFSRISTLVDRASRVMWITGGHGPDECVNAQRGLVTGFARIARSENAALRFLLFDIQEQVSTNHSKLIHAISSTLHRCLSGTAVDSEDSLDMEYQFREGQVFIPRLLPLERVNDVVVASGRDNMGQETSRFHESGRTLRLHVEKPGLLDSCIFTDDQDANEPVKTDELLIQVMACGVNFKDVFISLGQMKPGTRMAGECSGIVVAVGSDFRDSFKTGDRVCAIDATPFASLARVRGFNAHCIPATMSFSEAASVPIVFGTAYYSLVTVARLQAGQTVLIHAASGGVGQAAIKLAIRIGATIFATVSSAAKRQLLVDLYRIPKDHIFSSRTRQFTKHVMRLTNGKGVDVVLNSLAGEALHSTWSCISKFGTFVEIGKSDIHKKSHLSMDVFDRNATFASVDLSFLSEHKPTEVQMLLNRVMSMFAEGILTFIQPINLVNIGNIEHAFRLIQSRKHTGKVVLVADVDATVKATIARPQPLKLDHHATYVVAGGLGDLGRHVARFLAAHGAGHIALLSRRELDNVKRMELLSEFASFGAKLHILKCDITNRGQVKSVIDQCQATMPSIRGVIQAAMVLSDRLIGQMTAADLRTAVSPKVDGTRNILDALNTDALEHFIMLSSLTNIIGSKGQANYAAGNAFQDYLASHHENSTTQYVSLNLGMIEDSDVIALHPERIPGLLRAGCVPLRISQFLSLLGYSLSPQARRDGIRQIVIGVDRESLSAQEDTLILQNPMFSAMPYAYGIQSQVQEFAASKKIDQLVAEAKNVESISDIISSGIAEKIASLMARDQKDIRLDIPLAELGLDSLIAIELKNWISGSLRAALQTSEILDMPSITVLSDRVLKRSALVTDLTQLNGQKGQEAVLDQTPAAELSIIPSLPPLPLPELEDSVKLYLEAVKPFCSPEDIDRTENAISGFLEPDGLGSKFQRRLLQRAADAEIDGWQFDLYNHHVYLSSRAPINPFQQFGGSIGINKGLRSQANQAAIISAAVFEFKMILEAGDMAPDYLKETPLCMETVKWIFNSTREPHASVDQVRRYTGHDFMIVLRRGHIFKVELVQDDEPVKYQSLEATFDAILDQTHKEKMSVATLTAGDRDSWAEVRNVLKDANSLNEASLQAIETCAFIVCLDEGSPGDPSERWNQWLLSGPSNRWSDKTIQIIICENGVSGLVAEHSMVDGSTFQQINEHVYQRLSEHETSNLLAHGDSHLKNGWHTPRAAPCSELAFILTPTILSYMNRIKTSYTTIATPLTCEVSAFTLASLKSTILSNHGVPPKTGVQLAIQLAARLYFKYSPPSWETISMRAFRKGRVDIIQTALPAVVAFCEAALDEQVEMAKKREALMNAAHAHTVNVIRASRGHGFAGHFYALQEMRKEGEAKPSIFADDIYARTRPGKIMTDCTDWVTTSFVEAGWVMPDPEHVWIHYEIGDSGSYLFVKTPVKQAEILTKMIREAAQLFLNILTWKGA